MNILFLNTYPTWGGGETWMLDIAQGLKERGHHCTFAGREGKAWYDRTLELGLAPLKLNIRREIAPIILLKLQWIFHTYKIDLVLNNFEKEARLSSLARGTRNYPAIVNLKGLPLMKDNFYYRFSYDHLIDHTVVCANFIKEQLAHYSWLNMNHFTIIYNCLRLKKNENNRTHLSEFRQETGIPQESKIVGAVARLDYRKGLHDLLSAAPLILDKNPLVKFVIVGDGKEKTNLLTQAKMLGLRDNVIFTGFRKDLDHIFPHFDIFVLPSHFEGFPYVIQIAMHYKVPVIASRVNGIPDIITDGDNGLLISPQNPAEIAEKVNLLLSNPKLAHNLSERALNVLEDKFSYQHMIDQFNDLFIKIVSDKLSAEKQ
jgi:glycosyltransferase involved in cell wall biosynthesis